MPDFNPTGVDRKKKLRIFQVDIFEFGVEFWSA